jgi:RimJ/RimL family protein N-acetyltransferase
MNKMGMVREGILRHITRARGEWWDAVQYSLLDHEFKAL